jgi:hypothetical protein
MSQGFREMLANRRFAVPLIALLAFCFIGLILVGIVLILRPGEPAQAGPVAQVTTAVATRSQPATFTPSPTATRTPRPSPTLVPMGTAVTSGTGASSATTAPTASAEASPAATATTVSGGSVAAQETATPVAQDDELADTGLGWGLIIFSGVGLAALLAAARRLRLAG